MTKGAARQTYPVTQEEPDGFGGESPHVAIFVVEQMDVAVALHRAGMWERHLRRP